MKIEIGESIVMSWLRHAKNCQMVQMNWKPSISAWSNYNEDLIDEIIEKTQKRYQEKYELDLFKNNRSTSQIIQQGEIDVLGMEISSFQIKNIYGVDVAFHENGLNYGSKSETVSRVIKKMVRTAVTLIGYFDTKSAIIIFTSPKIHNSVIAPLTDAINDLNEYFNKEWDLDFNFKLIANEQFKDKIFNVITTLSKNVADTSELFMRSIQLYNLFDNETKRTINRTKQKRTKDKQLIESDNVEGYEEIKIGALVRSTFSEVVMSSSLPKEELENLLDEEYCKKKLDLNFPMLKRLIQGESVKEQRYVGNYPRYYANTIDIYKDKYLLTSEWYERNKRLYIEWLQEIRNNK